MIFSKEKSIPAISASRSALGFLVASIWTATMPGTALAAPDTILFNGRIMKMDDAAGEAEALAIEGDRIVAVGSNQQIRKLAAATTKRVDLGHRTVLPGLVDTHIHAIADGITYAARLDMAGVRDIAALQATIRDAARSMAPDQWVIVSGAWAKEQLSEKRLPTPAELQEAASDRAVFLLHRSQAAVVNARALEALKPKLLSMPGRFRLEQDTAGAGGLIHPLGAGASLVSLVADRLSLGPAEKLASLHHYFRALNRTGITGIIDQGGPDPEDYRLLFKLWQTRQLPVRVRMNVMVKWPPVRSESGQANEHDFDFVRNMVQLSPTGFGDDMLQMLGLGEVMSVGMWDGPLTRHVPIYGQAQFARFAAWAAANDYPVNVHATQDKTANAILDVFETIAKEKPIAPLRWRLEHVENASDTTLDRMQRLGIGYSVQNRMYLESEAYVGEHGATVSGRSPPINTAIAKGLIVTAGTDGSSPFNPFVNLRWLLDGLSADGLPTRTAQELPTRFEALRMYTVNAVHASFEERQRGSIEAGKLADLIVLDRDYFTVPTSEIDKLRPLLTIVGGRVVFRDAAFSGIE